jgi:hypothetical protein
MAGVEVSLPDLKHARPAQVLLVEQRFQSVNLARWTSREERREEGQRDSGHGICRAGGFADGKLCPWRI